MENVHAFDIRLAYAYGLDEAIIIGRFDNWLVKNKLNGKNYHDGTWWIHLTSKQFLIYFPYFVSNSKDKPGRRIQYLLNKLKKNNIIRAKTIKEFNSRIQDTTKSYTFTAEFLGSHIIDELGMPVNIATMLRFPTIQGEVSEEQKCSSELNSQEQKCSSERNKNVPHVRNKNVPLYRSNKKKNISKQQQLDATELDKPSVVVDQAHLFSLAKKTGTTTTVLQLMLSELQTTLPELERGLRYAFQASSITNPVGWVRKGDYFENGRFVEPGKPRQPEQTTPEQPTPEPAPVTQAMIDEAEQELEQTRQELTAYYRQDARGLTAQKIAENIQMTLDVKQAEITAMKAALEATP